MFKRLFFSIDIPDTVKKEIIFYKKELENSLNRGVRWVKDENLHITLLFLGQVEENTVSKLFKKVGTIKEKSFDVNIESVSYFPRGKTNAKLIWITVKSSGIRNLERRISEVIFPDFDIKKEQNYIPHITLGRIKQWDFRKLPVYQIPNLNDNLNLNFNITSFNICESKIKRDGPTYHILKTFNLNDDKK
jgi:RNA 2',3'-cyclic 3'-phosphodiesterase